MSRTELALAKKAIREDWPVTLEHRQAVVTEAMQLLNTGGPRSKVAAAKVLLACDAHNLRARQSKRPQEVTPDAVVQPTKEEVLRSLSNEEREKVFEAEELLEKAYEGLAVAPESDHDRLLWVVKYVLTPEQQQEYLEHHYRNRQQEIVDGQ